MGLPCVHEVQRLRAGRVKWWYCRPREADGINGPIPDNEIDPVRLVQEPAVVQPRGRPRGSNNRGPGQGRGRV